MNDNDREELNSGISNDSENATNQAGEATESLVDGVSSTTEDIAAQETDVIGNAAHQAVDQDNDAIGGALGEGTNTAASTIGSSAISDALRRSDATSSVAENQAVDTESPSLESTHQSAGDTISELMSSQETGRVRLTFTCEESSVAWQPLSASYSEDLNQPYSVEITLVTAEMDAEPSQLLGASCVLLIERGEIMRQVSGIVSEVYEEHTTGHHIKTEIQVEPALALLRQRFDTRIFQEMTVPQILTAVLEECLGPYNRTLELRLAREYPTCEYRTQYNETHLSFFQRLTEEEGIIYWFEFDEDTEKLVLADSPEQYGEVESIHGPEVQFTEYQGGVQGREVVQNFRVITQLCPTKVTTRHYDWTNAARPVTSDSSQNDPEVDENEPPNGALIGPEREHYEHDLEPLTLHSWDTGQHVWSENDATDQVRLRREQQAFDARVAQGNSSVLDMSAGKVFELTGHPRPELNGRYLLQSVVHDFGRTSVSNSFTCIPAGVPFRPRRVTPKPQITSVQTAKVTGPAGDEIHTDIHARIKIQFHWDRHGANDEHSSCYVRVMQPWAGAQWGCVFIPRIGMEVVVTFVNGDPDQPLVVGTVYNSDNPTPYTLPEEMTKSTIKTNSTLGGDGYNELTFEDKAGEEQIIVHAQKDYNETVENNHSTSVSGNQTNSVSGNQSESVGGDQNLSVTKTRTKTVTEDETNTLQAARTTTVTGKETLTCEAARETTVGSTESHQVTGKLTETFDGGRKSTIKNHDNLTVATGHKKVDVSAGQYLIKSSGQMKLTQGGANFLRLDGLVHLGTEGDFTITNGATTVVGDTGGNLTVSANTEIKLECGAGSLSIKSDGTIEINGTKVESKAGPSVMKVEASGASVAGPTSTVQGSGTLDLNGGIVNVVGGLVRVN